MRLRILGKTRIKKAAQCPYCKKEAGPAGTEVEIIQDMDTNTQYAAFSCRCCNEKLMLKG